ncbi:PQQ-binding-like beta-propeller repeat protein [bacterium]|nr:PQQ-binding-like beta-propeller repeat protein [bacterium]
MSNWTRILTIGLFFFFLVSKSNVSSEGAESWKQFLGSDGSGVVSESVPTSWGIDSNRRWRTELPGKGWSSPVVSQGRVYLTSALPLEEGQSDSQLSSDNSDQPKDQRFSLCMLIIDAASGELKKTVRIMEQNNERPVRMHAKNSHASPTPVIDGDRIFVHFGYQGTACLTLDGEVVWLNRSLYFPPTHGNGGSPVLEGGHLIFTCDGGKNPKVVALDAQTGNLVWEVFREVDAKKTFSFCTPTVIEVDGQRQVVAPGSDGVIALNPTSGDVFWDFRYTGYSVVPKPTWVAGQIIISTGFDNARMLAVDPKGRGLVTETNLIWEQDRNVPRTPSMIAKDGLLYSISDDGIALCTDVESGEVLYRQRIGGKFSSSPILAGDYLYFTSEQGVTTVVRSGPNYEKVAENDLEERTLATPAVWKNQLLIRTDQALYLIDESN